MRHAQVPAALQARLDEIRGGAKPRSPSVGVLASFAGHTDCHLATLAFVSRVDLDVLLTGTDYAAPFGQSPFAFARGTKFENILRQNGHEPVFKLLQEAVGFPQSAKLVKNVRKMGGMQQRADHTREYIREILKRSKAAPNLIDGGVLQTIIAGIPANFEADALAAQALGPIHVGEVKSFPVVDGRPDPDKLGGALDQVAVYIALLRDVIEELGGDPTIVTSEGLLITPVNVGMQPTMNKKDVTRRIDRFKRLTSSLPSAADLVTQVPSGISFGPVADVAIPDGKRIDTLHHLADRLGTSYNSGCLSTCGNALFCRERAFRAATPCVAGSLVVRALPEVATLRRADELSRGAVPSAAEVPAAAILSRAGRLYDTFAKRNSA